MKITKPTELFRRSLQWEHNDGIMYRLVVKPAEYGFDGIDFAYEKLDGHDGMGNERWIPIETTETSLFMATVGQYLVDINKDAL